MGTRVFKYGLLPPNKEGAAIIWVQLRAAHRYYNALIEHARKSRATYRELRAQYCPDVVLHEATVAALSTQIEALQKEVKAARAVARTGKIKHPATVTIKTLKAQKKIACPLLKQARERAKENTAFMDAVAAHRVHEHQDALNARKACAVYWGSYQLIEESAFAACKSSKTDPEFRRWPAGGRLGVQIQGGMTPAELFTEGTQVRIAPVSPLAWFSPTRGERRRHSRTRLKMRVGSMKDRRPIWVEWPMVMHRPLPSGAKIKQVTVHARKWCFKTRYSVDITVHVPDVVPSNRPGVIGIDFGWRLIGDKLRVAYWRDDKGREGKLHLPSELLNRLQKADELRAIRDKGRDAFLPTLVAAVNEIKTPPEWFVEHTKHLYAWKSFDRLHKLFYVWRAGKRFEDDEAAWALIAAWHHRDLHLYQYETGCRDGAYRRRRDEYRNFAAKLAREYGHVILERWNLAEMAERAEDDTKEQREPSHQRQQVALSELRGAIINAVERDGGTILRTPAAFTTRECSACHHIQSKTVKTLEHECEACHIRWDQDANAARNLLASGEMMLKDPEALAAANPPPKPKKPRFGGKRKQKKPSTKETLSQLTP